MPGIQVGVYPGYAVGHAREGDEVSSTYLGRHLTVREDELIHPFIADGFVNKGDPVVLCDAGVPGTYGAAVGIAFLDGAAVADWITIDTEGIWNLLVYAENDLGNSAIEIGDRLYIRAGTLPGAASANGQGDAEISKINNSATQIPFGYALGSMIAGGSGIIAVKVHWDPSLDNEARQWTTVADGAYGRHKTAVFAGGASTGLQYYDQRVTGLQTGGLYGWGTWMELAAAFTSNGSLLVAHEIGIYDANSTIVGNARVVMSQMQAILAAAPNSFHWWRLNLAAAGGVCTAVIAAANPETVGFVIDAVDNNGANKIGNVPLFDIVGHGIGFVEVFSV